MARRGRPGTGAGRAFVREGVREVFHHLRFLTPEERENDEFNLASDPRRGGRETVEARKRRRWRLQPTLLALEDRRLLSTFPVTNNAVDDVNTTGTLRWAIAQANAATSPSSIEIELGSAHWRRSRWRAPSSS